MATQRRRPSRVQRPPVPKAEDIEQVPGSPLTEVPAPPLESTPTEDGGVQVAPVTIEEPETDEESSTDEYVPNFVVNIEPPVANEKGKAFENPPRPKKKAKNKKAKRESILTPYQATSLMNDHRRELGLKEINSPMMYIMAGKGKFPVVRSDDGRWVIEDIEAFYAWMVAHNMRQVEKRNAAAKSTENETADAEANV